MRYDMPRKINDVALMFLQEHNFLQAQKMFYINKKNNPCHQTYNNLGYYLITEGMLCSNGRIRNALEIGSRYIMEASKMDITVTNLCALVKTIDYRINRIKRCKNKKQLYENACILLKRAIDIEYSDELQYNYLRFCYLLNPSDKQILSQTRTLVLNYTSIESVSLYFEILRAYGNTIEGNRCTDMFGEYIDDVDILMYYAKTEQYEKAIPLCDKVFSQYSVDAFVASAIIECSIGINYFEKAQEFSRKIALMKSDCEYAISGISNKILTNLHSSSSYRREKINLYTSIPPYLDQCCYFGCTMHDTRW